jgi:putative DNA-invertase from lambdoid prophage Rac
VTKHPTPHVSVGVYMRVSSDKQDAANQEPDLRRMVDAREGMAAAWDAAVKYVESESAVKERPAFERLREDCRTGKVRRLYIWAIDRFGRSMFANVRDVIDLDRWGVTVVSVRDSWLDTTGDPMTRKLLLAILSWVAEHERERLIQRTRAGLARAKASGKTLGRPKVAIPEPAVAKACELRQKYGARDRGSWRQVAKELERLGLGRWAHGTLAAACQKRVPTLDRGRPGFPPSSRR